MYAQYMTRITLSLNDDEIKELKELAKQEQRPISRQVVFMKEKYKKYHK